MPGKKHKKLRVRMTEEEVTQKEIAKEIGKSSDYVSRRMRGAESFLIDDAYVICDFLKIPYEEMYLYFPRGGVTRPENVKCRQ